MTARKPHVGDMALHRSRELDARPVAAVEQDHGKVFVRLQIGSLITDPIPAGNYTYTAPPK